MPAPVSTTIIAAPSAAADDSNLVPILLAAVGGVGLLAVAAIGFLVWAVLSSRRRTALAGAPVAAGTPVAAGGSVAAAPPAGSAGGPPSAPRA